MKYHQLVSNRAINEISDWLITRLEELDIEQPSVYSRLLLSLLQTSFKVDSAELLDILQLKDIEKPHKLLKKSNEELQRLAAVESLVEVSAEENKSKIINLVNELHSKLRRVEEKGTFDENVTSLATKKDSSFTKKLKKISKNDDIGDTDKNYYAVFPALSRSEEKALPKCLSERFESKSSSLTQSDEGLNNHKTSKIKSQQQLCWSTLMSSAKETSSLTESKTTDSSAYSKTTKQRKKRRNVARNSKLLNKIDVQYNAKNYDVYHNTTFLPKASKSNKKNQRNCLVSTKYQKGTVVARNKNFSLNDLKKQPSTSEYKSFAPWDMDFRDHWEMDHDLISEFLQKTKGQQHKEGKKYSVDVDEIRKKRDDDIEEDTMLKCLPDKLFHDDDDDDDESASEVDNDDELNKDSLTMLKMKFDANVKALWSDSNDDSFRSSPWANENNRINIIKSSNNGGGNMSSYVDDSYSMSLFNFSNQLRSLGVITPSDPHFYNFNFYKSNNTSSNNEKRSFQNIQQTNSSLISPATDKFIKLGTNLHSSIWSDCEHSQEDEISSNKIDNDENDETVVQKQIISIGAEMKSSTNDDDEDESEISLFNHSDASAFKRFKPNLKPTVICANYHPINNNNTKMTDHSVMDSSFEGENLLTSERTHFSPIICDGHSFAINNDWNVIKWERSPSGTLMHNNKQYMKWTLPAYDDDPSCMIDLVAMENESSYEFSIKFMVKSENDKGCQTDMNDFIRIGSQGLMESNEKYLRNVFTEYGYMGFSDNNMWQYHQEDSSDFSIAGAKSPMDVFNNDPYESWQNLKSDMLENDHLRLMKDELRVDCDEIMSVIQNLYITSDACEDDEADNQDDFEDMNHFYTDMLDESIDTFDDYKFYEGEKKIKIDDERFTPNLIEEQQFENFSDISRWSWSEDFTKDQEKYLNLLKWIQTTIFKESSYSDSNNNMQQEDHRKSNRKRRHSTCQNYLSSPPKALIEDVDSAKLLKVNIERSLFMPNIERKDHQNDHYYRNILQQHILIKQMEHTRPLTR